MDVCIVCLCCGTDIGLDSVLPQTKAAWHFLHPYLELVDGAVFSTPEYIPSYLVSRSVVIPPALDPLSHKNRDLVPTKLTV